MSNSCTNDHFVNHLLNSAVQGQWTMYLMSSMYQPSCEKMVTDAMLPPDCIIGASDFAVSLDRDNVCVVSAQKEIRFEGLGNQIDQVQYIVLMSCLGIVAATYGTDIINNLTRLESTGADLTVMFGEDRGIFGL